MYQVGDFNGAALPDHTLCFTFDDGPGETSGAGPGPRTLELANYLASRNIPSTFFVVGKYASDLPGVLPQVESLGHLIANHSYDHPNLVEVARASGDVVCQITRTDALIRNWIDAPTVYVRPPYGSWSAGVAASLNANLTASLSHLGPIGWDIDGGDWACWKDGTDPHTCMLNYLQKIETIRRGIVLFHDCTADQDVVKKGNRTLEMVQLLVPQLQQRGYRSVRLDFVPGLAGRTDSALRIALRGSNGLFVSPQGGGGGSVLVNGPAVGPWEPLDLISLEGNRVAFRTITGHFLTCDAAAGNVLHAGSWLSMQNDSIFTYQYL